MSRWRWGMLSVLLTLSIFLALGLFPMPAGAAGSAEVNLLMDVKNSLQDPDDFLQSWVADDRTPCAWHGVSCDSSSLSVTGLDLSNMNLSGPVPTQVCQLQNLTHYNVGNNFLYGDFPEKLLNCSSLEYLNLSQNLIVSLLPDGISRLQNLRDLDLNGNNFTGLIPPAFGDLPLLQSLNLTNNLLNGTIPGFLGNLSNLKWLDIAYNPFTPGVIPYELGNLKSLVNLHFAVANLVGRIPDSFGNLTELTYFLDLSRNRLEGVIPPGVMSLPRLQRMELYSNSLSGQIPLQMAKLGSIIEIDFSENNLSGIIPPDIAKLPTLELLHLWDNQLEGEIPPALGDLPRLCKVRLFTNKLTGQLPQNLGQEIAYIYLDVSDNRLSGPLPPDVCRGGQLQDLLLFKNSLSGEIPLTYGNCSSLSRFRVDQNNLRGQIPDEFWDAPNLVYLDLSDNFFTGSISSSIAAASILNTLLLSVNNFSGSLPSEIGKLSKLNRLMADQNQFSGSIPPEVGNLSGLNVLIISDNQLSGEIPVQISKCFRLSQLNLSRNNLTGVIPASLGNLNALNDLDLSHNRLGGGIPSELQQLRFSSLDLSFNNLSGPVPASLNNEAFNASFIGNAYLCARGLQSLPACSSHELPSDQSRHRARTLPRVVAATFASAAFLLLLGSFLFYKRYRSYSRAATPPKGLWSLTSFHKLDFSEYEVLSCLDQKKVIGRGGSGTVYKATLSNGQDVAVKELWSSSRSDQTDRNQRDLRFDAEVETLGRLRHKNIVKLLCCCSRDDAKLLVYEYMPEGSLGDQLHGGSKAGFLDWPTRHRIALGAAQGLSYLHHDYSPPVLHCDVKSNNILLDANYEARVSDFGLAKILQGCGKPVSVSRFAGTYGYMAPEYAYSLKVNEKSDIYSFGVVLMELLTGRRPVEPEFGDGVGIVKWVHNNIHKKRIAVEQVFDPRLQSSFQEEMLMVLRISVLCTSDLPLERPSMREVVQMLQEANPMKQEHILGGRLSKSIKDLKPYYIYEALTIPKAV